MAVARLAVLALIASPLGVATGTADVTGPPVAFALGVEHALGGSSLNVAIGDLDGDSHADLIAAGREIDEVSVLFGNGDGTFAPPVGFGTGPEPLAVAVADLDGDGDLDLVVTNSGRSFDFDDMSLSVLLNNGDGTFAPHSELPAPYGPLEVDIEDVNGDSDPDLLVTHSGQFPFGGTGPGRMTVWLGTGDGTFARSSDIQFNTDPLTPWLGSTAVADVTGDTHLDIVRTGWDQQRRLWVLVGNGDGTFAPGVAHLTSDVPYAVGIGDLDGDGSSEVAVAYDRGSTPPGGSYVAVLTVDAGGAVSGQTSFSLGTSQPRTLALGDLNGDGHLDVTAGFEGEFVSVLLGNGDGTFEAPMQVPTGPESASASVSVADLDGDDRLDIVTGHYDAWSLWVLLNETVPVAPDAPTIIKNATAGNSEATVSWTAPASDGGSPITGYVVTPYVGYFPFPPITFYSTATTQVITGRVGNGLTYRFRVQAINAVGTSGYSTASNPVYPSTTVAPGLGAPTITQNATAGGNWSATVSWTAPAADGGSPVTGYLVTPYVGYFALQPYMFHSTATTQTLTDVYPQGASFRFRVQAVNANGTGPFSKASNPVIPTA